VRRFTAVVRVGRSGAGVDGAGAGSRENRSSRVTEVASLALQAGSGSVSQSWVSRQLRITALLAIALIGVAAPSLAMAASGGLSIVSSPNAGEMSELNGVGCATASQCWAVGVYFPGGEDTHIRTLIERYRHGAWQIVGSPNATSSQSEGYDLLHSVACTSKRNCWAVGESHLAPEDSVALIEHYDGKVWGLASPAVSIRQKETALSAVTCLSESDCWAVGRVVVTGAAGNETLIEHYDGKSWSEVSSANMTGESSTQALAGVACTRTTSTSDDCWAVGTYATLCPLTSGKLCFRNLIEHYDGSTWSIVTSPNGSPNGNPYSYQLNGVACATASYCVAAGVAAEGLGSFGYTVIERYDGSAWSGVSGLGQNGTEDRINAVSCSTRKSCVAVGSRPNEENTLVEQNSGGGAWMVMASPNEGSINSPLPINVLNGVTCIRTCFAVGRSGQWHERGTRTLIEQGPTQRR
jgi:hypothetical protein